MSKEITKSADLSSAKKEEPEQAVRIFCSARDCLHNSQKRCSAETIHLQNCTPDNANVFGCSEFEEEKP